MIDGGHEQALQPGARIGEWIVISPLGRGGMGTVFRCQAALSERVQAAVKVVRAGRSSDDRERFVREVESLSALRHQSIVRVLGWGDGEPPWLAMELIEGETLAQRLRRGPIDPAEAVGLMIQVADGLAHAHARGIFHRDLKPSNLMLTPEGQAVLIDFGIAAEAGRTAITGERVVPGTLSFMPPEVFLEGRPEPVASDVYGLGQLLCECLTGRAAFSDPGDLPLPQRVARVMAAKIQMVHLDPGPAFPRALRAVVAEATRAAPSARLPTVAAFRDRLRALDLEGVGPAASGPTGPTLVTREPAGETTFLEPDGPVEDTEEMEIPPLRRRGFGWAVALGMFVVLGLGWGLRPRAVPLPSDHGSEVEPISLLEREGYSFVELPPGEGWVGSPESEPGRDPDEMRHGVRLTRGYELGQTEVTRSLWAEVMGEEAPCPSELCTGSEPVSMVRFDQVIDFCNRLSVLEGLSPVYSVDDIEEIFWNQNADGYRLPSEAEWTLAARGTALSTFLNSDLEKDVCVVANVADASAKRQATNWVTFPCDDRHPGVAEVASRKPWPPGLYDLTGNVAEWVWDRHASFERNIQFDPVGPAEGRARVVRGGSYGSKPSEARLANREARDPAAADQYTGFRIARSLP